MESIMLSDIDGIIAGHATDEAAGTGCTVIICPEGATPGVDVRGGGPATRETDLVRSENMVQKIHAVMLSGGSAYGLDAAGGAMRWLEEHHHGFPVGVGIVPIVCGASIFDLACGAYDIRPDAAMGYAACEAAISGVPLAEGNVGAGAGATVGKFCGMERSTKTGVGIAGVQEGSLKVAAVSVVNALGTVVGTDGSPIAGVVSEDGRRLLRVDETIAMMMMQAVFIPPRTNTTISCVVTNAKLSKASANKTASIAHDGYARAIRPVHTSNDGDTIFVLATGEIDVPPDLVGVMAADMCEQAIRRAATQTPAAFGLHCAADFS